MRAAESDHANAVKTPKHNLLRVYNVLHTNWDFLLCDDSNTVLPSDRHGGQSSLVDGFEGIL